MTYIPGPEYPYNWNRRRWAVFGAVGYICQMCNIYSKGNLHYHHIRPIKCGGTHHPMNMIPVCGECHEIIHSGNYKGSFLDLGK